MDPDGANGGHNSQSALEISTGGIKVPSQMSYKSGEHNISMPLSSELCSEQKSANEIKLETESSGRIMSDVYTNTGIGCQADVSHVTSENSDNWEPAAGLNINDNIDQQSRNETSHGTCAIKCSESFTDESMTDSVDIGDAVHSSSKWGATESLHLELQHAETAPSTSPQLSSSKNHADCLTDTAVPTRALSESIVGQELPHQTMSKDSNGCGAGGSSKPSVSLDLIHLDDCQVHVEATSEMVENRTQPLANAVNSACLTEDMETEGETAAQRQQRRKTGSRRDKTRHVLPACNCSLLRCSEQITEEGRQTINSTFWQLKGLNKRRQWMLDHMKWHLTTVSSRKWLGKKRKSRTFFLPDVHGKLVRVCKDFFIRTLGFDCVKDLSDFRPFFMRMAPTDQCCRSHHKMTVAVLLSVKRHIQSKLEESKFKKQFNSIKAKGRGCGFVQMCYKDFQVYHNDQSVGYQSYQNIFLRHCNTFSKADRSKCLSDLQMLKEVYAECGDKLEGPGLNSCGEFAHGDNLSHGPEHEVCGDVSSGQQKNFTQRQNEGSGGHGSVVMQLDSESDAIIITRNVSDSESETEAQGHDHRKHFRRNEKLNLRSNENEVKATFSPSEVSNVSSQKGSECKISSLKEKYPVQPACHCENRCWEKIGEDRRKQIHNMFWFLTDYTKQKLWIQRQRVVSKWFAFSLSSRTSRSYRLADEKGRLIQVCSHFFLSTLGLFSNFSVYKKNPSVSDVNLDMSASCPVVKSEDNIIAPSSVKKTKVIQRRKREGFEVSFLEQHIQGFIQSGKNIPGLRREESSKDSRVTIKNMHQDFLRTHPDVNVSYATYNKLYHEQISAFKVRLFAGSSDSELLIDDAYHSSGYAGESLGNTEGVYGNLSNEGSASDATDLDKKSSVPGESLLQAQVHPEGGFSKKRRLRNLSKSVNYNDSLDFPLYQEDCRPVKKRSWKLGESIAKSVSFSESFGVSSKKKMKRMANSSSLNVDRRTNSTDNGTPKRKRGRPRKHPYPEVVDFQDDRGNTDGEVKELSFRSEKEKKQFRKSYLVTSAKKKNKHPILPACKCNRRKCFEKIPEARRVEVHETFWSLKSYNERKEWMLKYVQRWEPQTKKLILVPGRKNDCRKYFLPDQDGNPMKVCRVFFLHTLGFKWDRIVDEIIKTVPKDQIVVRKVCKELKKPQREMPEIVVKSVIDFWEESEKRNTVKEDVGKEEVSAGQTKEPATVKEKSDGAKVRKVFEEYRAKHKNIYLGYHNFRRILRDFLEAQFQSANVVSETGVGDVREAVDETEEFDELETVSEIQQPPSPSKGLTKKKTQAKPKSLKVKKDFRRSHKKVPAAVMKCVKEFWETVQESLASTPPVKKSNRGRKRLHEDRDPPVPGGRKVKDLFVDFRIRNKNVYLGYHNFRRILRNLAGLKCGPTEVESELVQDENEPARVLKKPKRKLPELVVKSVKDFWESSPMSASSESDKSSEVSKVKTYNKEPLMPEGVDIKKLFSEYRAKHTNIYLGYHNFRRILRSILNPDVERIEILDPNENKRSTKKSTSGSSKGNNKQIGSNEVNMAGPAKLQLETQVNQAGFDATGLAEAHLNDQNVGGFENAHCAMTSFNSTFAMCHNELKGNDDCILDVGSGLLKRKGCMDTTINSEGPGFPVSTFKCRKRKNPSVRNNKSNYPMLPPCNCTKRKCHLKIPEVRRRAIHEMFWGLAGYNERKQWMLENIKRTDIKRRVVFYDEGKPKKHESRWYYLPDVDGKPLEVCKAFFLRTLGYKWDSVIDTIGKTTPKGETVAAPDRRGRRPPAHKISEEAIASMTQYIESVCRSSRCFQPQKGQKKNKTPNMIPYGLTMKHLFEDYKSKHPNHKYGYESFRKVFRTVKADWIQSLPEGHSQDEPEPSFPTGDDSMEQDYPVVTDVAEDVDDFQPVSTEVIHVPQSASYSSIAQYTSHQEGLAPETVPLVQERKSCLYQYSSPTLNPIQHPSSGQHHQPHHQPSHSSHPPHQHHHHHHHPHPHIHPHQDPHSVAVHDVAQVAHNSGVSEHYRPMDNEQFMKYNLYNNNSPSTPGATGHFQPMSAADSLAFNPGSRPDIDPSTSGGGQFPSYLMPSPEPFRRQVYHHMASQYHSILHHIAESNRFFNYNGLPPSTEGNFQMGQEKIAPFGNRQDFPRDSQIPSQNQNHFPHLKHPQGYVQEVLPMQGQFLDPNFQPHVQQQEGSSMDLASYSDDNESGYILENPEMLGKERVEGSQHLVTLPVPEKEKGKSSKKSPRKKKGETKVKVKRERKIKVKSARNNGEHYPMLPACNCKKKKCSEKFPEEKRQQIHDMFWKLENYNVRKQWMLERIERTDPKRRREIIGNFKKGESRWYFLPDDEGKNVEVCKTFFLHTLGYKWDSVIDTIRRTIPKGEKVSKPDQRGRKPPAHKLPVSVIRSVIQYIESMQQASELHPKADKDTKKEKSGEAVPNSDSASCSQIVIPYGLTMKDLFDDYKAKHAGHKLGYESFRRLYRAVSNSEQILMDNGQTGEEALLNPDGDQLVTF
ncbi:uncharacterized protein LOC101856214 [Aplysia californica]|uniref:Uncharacterized protein LOC101856214 n=1 Tax=Aplysia californica TaxID=6500 RepID=A0ABM1A9K5_APLCA|nr:uncharacterized protein LOC101856214 [Aplysia californica]XP_012943434.1 uncharacterized protein LOC101856214 [Aplysia californica]